MEIGQQAAGYYKVGDGAMSVYWDGSQAYTPILSNGIPAVAFRAGWYRNPKTPEFVAYWENPTQFSQAKFLKSAGPVVQAAPPTPTPSLKNLSRFVDHRARELAMQGWTLESIRLKIRTETDTLVQSAVISSETRHEPEYWQVLRKSWAWGFGISVAVLLLAAISNQEPPSVSWIIFLPLAILFWATVVGMITAGEKETEARNARQRDRSSALTVQIATALNTGVTTVWATQSNHRWNPSGPSPSTSSSRHLRNLPEDWLEFITPIERNIGQCSAKPVSPLDSRALRGLIVEAARESGPHITKWFIVFVASDEVIDASTLALATESGVAIFGLDWATDNMYPKSELASESLNFRSAPCAPAEFLWNRWNEAVAKTNREAVASLSSSASRRTVNAPAVVEISREQIPTWQGAEDRAAELLAGLGATNVVVSQRTRDGGIDIRATNLVCQVKQWTGAVPESEIQRLAGIAMRERSKAVFLTNAMYRPDAVSFAIDTGMMLFRVDSTWTSIVEGVTPTARLALSRGIDAVLDS